MARKTTLYLPTTTEMNAAIAAAVAAATGGLAAIAASGSASDLVAGTVPAARLPNPITGQGIFAQTFDRVTRVVENTLVDQRVYYTAIQLLAGQTVTNLSVSIAQVSNSATLAKVALYKKDGTQLAVSASVHATFNASTGIVTVAMGTPYVVPATDIYYAAILSVGGTPPHVNGGNAYSTNTSFAIGAVGGAAAPVGIQSSQTDMPSPGVITSTGATSQAQWIGAS